MGLYDIDETSAGAILFKNTYGIPTEGDDPESEGRIFEYSQVVYAERYDKLGSAIASGNSPDLFPFDAQDYPYGVLRGRYQPIDEIIDLDGAKWQAAKEMMDQYKLNGRYYCAFWDVSINNVMYDLPFGGYLRVKDLCNAYALPVLHFLKAYFKTFAAVCILYLDRNVTVGNIKGQVGRSPAAKHNCRRRRAQLYIRKFRSVLRRLKSRNGASVGLFLAENGYCL